MKLTYATTGPLREVPHPSLQETTLSGAVGVVVEDAPSSLNP